MAVTYKLIASSTVGAGGVSSIDFTSIPSTYTDLLLKVSARSTVGSNIDNYVLYFNNSSASFSSKRLYGGGTGSGISDSPTSTFGDVVGSTATANTFSNEEFYIPNYTSSNNKSFSYDGVGENNATSAYAAIQAGLWSNTAAINRITLTLSSTSFVQYTTAYLYGIKNS